MEPNSKLVVITLVLALTLTAATGQTICGMTVAGLNACKPYVSAQNPSVAPLDPKSPCCAALSKADYQCLCNMKSSPFARGIDFGLASKLPEKCGLPSYSC